MNSLSSTMPARFSEVLKRRDGTLQFGRRNGAIGVLLGTMNKRIAHREQNSTVSNGSLFSPTPLNFSEGVLVGLIVSF